MVLAVLVHDPGHLVGAGAHVGSRDVGVGAEQVVDRVDEPAGDPLEFPGRVLAGIDRHAPLGAAVGNVDDRRLPGHQGRQGSDFVKVDLGMVAKASLERATGIVVLHAVANKGGQLARVSLDRDLDLDLPLGRQQEPPHARREIELVGRRVEVHARGVDGSHG